MLTLLLVYILYTIKSCRVKLLLVWDCDRVILQHVSDSTDMLYVCSGSFTWILILLFYTYIHLGPVKGIIFSSKKYELFPIWIKYPYLGKKFSSLENLCSQLLPDSNMLHRLSEMCCILAQFSFFFQLNSKFQSKCSDLLKYYCKNSQNCFGFKLCVTTMFSIHFSQTSPEIFCSDCVLTEEQIRWVFDDNSKIIFVIKAILMDILIRITSSS